MQDFNGGVLLAPGAVANLLGVSTQTLRVYESMGRIKAAMLTPGRQRRYVLSEVERLRAEIQQEQETTEPVDPEVLNSFVGKEVQIPLAKLF